MPHSSAAGPPTDSAAASSPTVSPWRTLIPNGDPVLAARFDVPPIPTTFVHRPRLAQRLSDGCAGPLQLVNGPAGAGKTLLVADWIARADLAGPVAWLTVEHGDNAPGIFWGYLLEALRHHGVELPDEIGGPVRADTVDSSLLDRLAVQLSRLPEPTVLVLDEFERVSDAEVAAGLHTLLRHAAPGLRLVIISRTEPLLPLHRYRTTGEITDIRAADLAFTTEETAVLLGRHGLSLSPEGVQGLTERTGGWAAGLRLSALAMQGAAKPEKFLQEFEAGRSTIADFLLAEVLDAQPAETQDLLLRTSILERTSPELANALTGRQDAEQILARLQHSNAFIEPVGQSWYRHHPLFAEILQVHMHARYPGLDSELHRRAARWLSNDGQLSKALSHAAAAGDWDYAAQQFIEGLAIGQLFTGLDTQTLDELFSGMAPEASGPAPALVRAARSLARYDTDHGLDQLRQAEEQLARSGEDTAVSARLSCAFLHVLAARSTGAADLAETAASDAEKLLQQVPPERLAAHPELPALLLTNLGSALLWEGRFDAARTALNSAVETCWGPSTAVPRHESLSRLALIDYLCGWPSRAADRAQQARAEAEQGGLAPSSRTGVGELVLGAVAIDRADLPNAQTALDRAAESAGAEHDPVMTIGLALLRSRLLLAKGDPKAALHALPALQGPGSDQAAPPWVSDRIALAGSAAYLADGDPRSAVRLLDGHGVLGPERAAASARAHVATGQPEEASRILNVLPSTGTRAPAVSVQALLARAQVADALGYRPNALQLLTRALAVARPEHLRRPFQEVGPWVRRLLRDRPALAGAHAWLPSDLIPEVRRPAVAETAAALVVQPLSEREHDVLERVAQMMSTDEIAADLCVSVNTVKTHLKGINRKLSANRRGEAVRRARQLHLI